MIFIRESTPPLIRPSPGQTIKFPKGRKNGVARKHLQRMQTQAKDADGNKAPFVPPKRYEIHFDRQKVEAYLRAWEAKGYLRLKPEKLQWTPYLLTRTAQEAAVDLPAQNNVPAPASPIIESRVLEEPLVPVTPKASTKMAADSPMVIEEGKDDRDEMPMVVDDIPPEPKTRTRSSGRSPTKTPAKEEVSRPLRSNHDTSVPTPSSPPTSALRSLRTRSSHLNVPSPSVLPSVMTPSASTRAGRKNNRKSSKNGGENEENVAVKSPVEELTPGRTLRSGRNEALSENKRSPVMSRAPPIRKRRRIESSPEIEVSPTPEQPVSQTEKPNAGEDVDLLAMVVDEVLPENQVNGDQAEVQPVEIETPETATLVAPSTTSAVEEEIVAQEALYKEEVKTEDGGTPLTSLTSRHSLPSDDTIYASEMTKTYTDYHGAVHAESDMRSTLVGDKSDIIYVDMESWHDEDAEGEDEDAEGEPDMEMLYS